MPLRLLLLACFAVVAYGQVNRIAQTDPRSKEPSEWEGPLTVLVQEDFLSGRSRMVRWIRVDGRELELEWPGAPETQCATRVKVRGIRSGNRIVVASGRAASDITPCTVTGPQNVAVLLVNYKSTSLPPWLTVSMASSAFFEPGWSMDQFWRDNSFGATTATGGVFGPFTLDEDYGCYQPEELRDAAIRAAASVVDFKNYTRLFIVAPNSDDCWWSGLSTVGCVSLVSPGRSSFTASVTWIMTPAEGSREWMAKLVTHESGHGLGLNHARSLDYDTVALGPPAVDGTRNEYGDVFSNMGTSAGHWSAPQKNILGWFRSPDAVTEVDAPGTFLVAPYETEVTGTQVLRIRRGPGTEQWLWLEYRQPQGLFDATLPQAAFSGAVIHYEDSANPASTYTDLLDFNPSHRANDFRQAPLPSGSTWHDLYSPLGLTIGDATADGLRVAVAHDALCVTLPSSSIAVEGEAQAGVISISAPRDCSWTAVSAAKWITITGGQSGSDGGIVSFGLVANTTPGTRTGSIFVGRQRFAITQKSSVLALTLSLAHSGAFAPGGTGTFTATVSNTGDISTKTAVTIRSNPGPGLAISGLAGEGWTCSSTELTCRRTDALQPGQRYPAIVVTVSVAPNAPVSVNLETDALVLDDSGAARVVASSSDDATTSFGSGNRRLPRFLNKESPESGHRQDRPIDR